MMIRPTTQSSNRSPETPLLFPECLPASVVQHVVELPESIIEIPAMKMPEFAELTPGVSSLPEDLPAPFVYLLRHNAAPVTREVVAPAPNRIVEILELGYAEFKRKQTEKLPAHAHQAARMIQRCRTSALGGHVEACPDGHIERVWYNSCGHRCCPRCAYRKQQNWLEKQRKKLLPVRHFHATFTIPHEFNDLWWHNVKQMATLLFHSASQALQELLADPQRVGVRIGLVAALHTWDDRLLRHPHLHCLVTGGGLTAAGEWKDSYTPGTKPFLVRVEPVMQRFRSLFCRKLEKAVKKGDVKLPKGCRKQQMLNTIKKVNRANWQVHLAKPPEDGGPTTEEILAYQAHAVAGGPMSAARIVGIERTVTAWAEGIQAGQTPQLSYLTELPLTNNRVTEVSELSVSFRWGEYDPQTGRRKRDKTETIPLDTFIQRLLWHVPPPHLQTVRSYGLYSTAKKHEYQQLKTILPDLPQADTERPATSAQAPQEDSRLSLHEFMEQRRHCPVCGKRFVLRRVLPSTVTGKYSPRDKARVRALKRARRKGG